MNYTIISARDFATNQVVDIVKDGNTYDLVFTDSEELFIYKCKTIEEVYKMFADITECFARGWYTFEQRKERILKRGEQNETN